MGNATITTLLKLVGIVLSDIYANSSQKAV
jgi:hypothetical protein